MPWTEPSGAQTPSPSCGYSGGAHRVEGLQAQLRGLEAGRLEVGELARGEHADAGDVGVDLGGAGGEVDFGGAGDAEGEAVGVFVGQLVAGAQGAVAGEVDSAAGLVGEVDADRADVAELEHRALVVAAGARQPGAAEGERA